MENKRRPVSHGYQGESRTSMAPFIVIIVLLGLALIGAIYMLACGYTIKPVDDNAAPAPEVVKTVYTASEAQAPQATPQATASAEAPKTDATKQNSQQIDPESNLGKILLAVNGYYTAQTPEEKLNFILDADRLKDTVTTYYNNHPIKSRALRAIIEPPSSLPIHGVSYWKMRVGLDDGSQGFVAVRFVGKDPKVDWESEVRYSSFDWNEWVADPKAQDGDFRVYVVANNVHEAPYNDAAKFFSVKLSTMGSDRAINAYLDLSNDDQRDLAKRLVMAQGTPMECVLTLKRVGDSTPTALVLKLVNDSWVVPTSAK
jgi:hypothetical protein